MPISNSSVKKRKEVPVAKTFGEKIIRSDFKDEVKRSFLDYAMSVIVSRALPDVRDGLKPVHRRILYAMHQENLFPDRRFTKSAGVVGEVIKKYHPHGDAAVYDALVRLVQDFNMRYPLVQGQGNFGSIDGDPAAAYRYTEVKLAPVAMEMLKDLEKETVDFVDNFDGTTKEPVVLPTAIPQLLVNGSSGIAVGMATNIPPHNLSEVIDALVHLIDSPQASVADLMKVLPGPDFPTGGIIAGSAGIQKAYETGHGSIIIRGRHEIESVGNRERIVIRELPFQVNKAALVEKIALLVKEKKLTGISEVRDESDRRGMRVVIELKKDIPAKTVLNALYKHTNLQISFGILMLALVDGTPRTLNLKQMLEEYLKHRKEVVVRRSSFELRKAEERAHILEGLKIALQNLDAVIALIRKSESVEKARRGLMEKFSLSKEQAQAILDMRLSRLTRLEMEKLEKEYKELIKTINELQDLLKVEKKIWQKVKEELLIVKKIYGDPRRTLIAEGETEKLEMEQLIPEQPIIITVTRDGYIKRMPTTYTRSQRRGGRGIIGATTKKEDELEHLRYCSTHDFLLFFTEKGRVYRIRGFEVKEGTRKMKGTPLANFIPLEGKERVTAVIAIAPGDYEKDAFLCMATKKGTVKKTHINEFANIYRAGKIALALEEGDELEWVDLCRKGDHIFLFSRNGKAICFQESNVRPMGRQAKGMRGMRLKKGDEVVGMVVKDLKEENGECLLFTECGYAKRLRFAEFRPQGRGGSGVIAIKTGKRTGRLVGALMIQTGDHVFFMSKAGLSLKCRASEISVQKRQAQGVRVMKLNEGDALVAVSVEEKE